MKDLRVKPSGGRLAHDATGVALAFECTLCFLAASFESGQSVAMAGISSAEAAEQARFAIELYAIGALNLLASIGFLLRQSGWGWWLLFAMQIGIFVTAWIEGVLTDLGWFFFSSLPLLTAVLLLAFRHGAFIGTTLQRRREGPLGDRSGRV